MFINFTSTEFHFEVYYSERLFIEMNLFSRNHICNISSEKSSHLKSPLSQMLKSLLSYFYCRLLTLSLEVIL